MSSSSLVEISMSKVPEILPVLWASKKVGMLWGPPGVGKSQVMQKLAEKQSYIVERDERLLEHFPELEVHFGKQVGRRIFDVRLLLMNPSDIKGLPVFNSKKEEAEWLVTNNFPMSKDRLEDFCNRAIRAKKDGKDAEVDRILPRIIRGIHDQHSIVFLDELSLAPKLVQGASLQLVLDRQISEYRLPDGVDVVAAGNRVEDKVGATAMSSALVSRMVHFNIETPIYETWKNWAIENGIAPEVIGYLNFQPDKMFEFDAKTASGRAGSSSYPCPRTWEFASDLYRDSQNLLNKSDKNFAFTVQTILAGTVGEGTAAEFMAWVETFMEMPDPALVLTGEVTDIDYEDIVNKTAKTEDARRHAKRKALSMKYAFLTAVTTKLLMNFTVQGAHHVAAFIMKMGADDPEWGTLVCRRIITQVRNDSKLSAVFVELMNDKNKDKPFKKMVSKLSSFHTPSAAGS